MKTVQAVVIKSFANMKTPFYNTLQLSFLSLTGQCLFLALPSTSIVSKKYNTVIILCLFAKNKAHLRAPDKQRICVNTQLNN